MSGFDSPRATRGLSVLCGILLLLHAGALLAATPSEDELPAAVREFAAKNLPLAQSLAQGQPYTDDFGFSVAANERFAVIGAPAQAAGELNFRVGAAYVFARVNSASTPWRFLHVIYGEDADTTDADDDRFGQSVALSGGTLVVGSPGDDPVNVTPTVRTGSVYVYTFDAAQPPAGQFVFRRKVRASAASLGAAGNAFGDSVALAGRHLVVGAPGADAGASDAGAMAVFDCPREGSPNFVTCTHRQTIASPEPNARGAFGQAVAATLPIRANGAALAIVGAPNNCVTGACTTGPGAAYLYAIPLTGAIPAGLELSAPDGASGDQFGAAVAFDGPTVAVGAPGDNLSVGSIYIFARTLAGAGFQVRLQPPAFQAMRFGSAVALRGTALAGGAPRRTVGSMPSQHGSTFLFERIRGTWVLRDEVFRTSSPIDTQVFFGAAVALGGGTLVVGEPEGPGVTFGRPGAAYAFRVGRSARLSRLGNDNATPADDAFGTDVAVSGGFMAVGVPARNVGAFANAGQVRLYQQTAGGAWVPTNQFALPLPADSNRANARFGHAVAFTENAQHLIVGSPGALGAGGAGGAVYVYERSGSMFLPAVQNAKLVRPSGAAGDDFGAAIDVSPSANMLIVGAPEAGGGIGGVTMFRDPTAPGPKSGKVGLAKFDDGGNVPTPEGGGIGDKWGSSVATDGEQAVAGAPETGAGGGDGFATMIDDPEGDGSFDNTGTMTPPPDAGGADEQDFGSAVAIDDGMIAVGAPGTNVPDAENGGMNADEGIVYAYEVGDDLAEPTPLEQPGGDIGDKWGSSVDFDDGGLVSGGPGADVPTTGAISPDQGAVAAYECYFDENGNIDCAFDETLYGTGGGGGDAIGTSVDATGGEIALGAPEAGAGDEGAVFVSEDLFPIDGLFRNGFE